jgi:putative transcriptional regulator
MMPAHHLPEEILLDHAAGSQPEALAVLVATHLALCPACRAAAADCEALGGALLCAAAAEPLADDALARTLARLDAEDDVAPAPPRPVEAVEADMPQPLAGYLGGSLDALAWRRLSPGIEAAALRRRPEAAPDPAFPLSLLRIAPGAAAPRHSHRGCEATLVLRGAYSDAGGRYERGDVQLADAGVDHRPVAAAGEVCLCLVYRDAPLKLTGPLGRWLNPFIRS